MGSTIIIHAREAGSNDMTYAEIPPWETPIMDRATFLDYCKVHKVDPIHRLLLLTDGTLVEHLEALYQAPVRLNLQHQQEVPMPDADADWLGVPRGCPALSRHAFLHAGDGNGSGSPEQTVLFAMSLFPLASLPSVLREEMQRGHLPVGKIIRDLPTQRDRLEVARRPVPQLSEALGFLPTLHFWIRRYRLTLATGASGTIFEAFPPRAIVR